MWGIQKVAAIKLNSIMMLFGRKCVSEFVLVLDKFLSISSAPHWEHPLLLSTVQRQDYPVSIIKKDLVTSPLLISPGKNCKCFPSVSCQCKQSACSWCGCRSSRRGTVQSSCDPRDQDWSPLTVSQISVFIRN